MSGKPTFATLCTGIGGFDVGLERHGMECVTQCELDKDCNRVLARHWPNVPRTTDVCGDDTEELVRRLRPDWLAFGFPCQDLSVAGRRAGLDGKRSGLFFRCCELIAACNPGGFCIENVPGLLSSNERRDMGTVLWTLGQLGYGWAYRVLDAQWFGVAQRRRRVFIVGCFGNARRAAEILFERESLPWDSPPRRETRTGVAALTARGVGTCGADDNQAQAGHLIANCLQTTANDYSRADGFNAVVSALDTKPYADHEAKESRLVPVVFGWNKSASQSMRISEQTTNPLQASETSNPAVAYQCQGTNVGPMGTLRAGNGNETGGVPFIINEKGRPEGRTLEHRADGTVNALLTPSGGRAGIGVGAIASPTFGVRRLTPRECERLQGFADDWTRYAADGKEISDSARYRMLGNAVCVNVASWLARRIASNP